MLGVEVGAAAEPSGAAGAAAEPSGAAGAAAEPLLRLDGSEVRFAAAASEPEEGLVEIALELPHELPGGAAAIEIGGVRLRRV